jgi:hypothetical protein
MYLFRFDKCNCTELARPNALETKRKPTSFPLVHRACFTVNLFHLIEIIKLVIISYLVS